MDESYRTFTATVKFTKETPGLLTDEINFGKLIKIIQEGIDEACARTVGVINSYMVSEVLVEKSGRVEEKETEEDNDG